MKDVMGFLKLSVVGALVVGVTTFGVGKVLDYTQSKEESGLQSDKAVEVQDGVLQVAAVADTQGTTVNLSEVMENGENGVNLAKLNASKSAISGSSKKSSSSSKAKSSSSKTTSSNTKGKSSSTKSSSSSAKPPSSSLKTTSSSSKITSSSFKSSSSSLKSSSSSSRPTSNEMESSSLSIGSDSGSQSELENSDKVITVRNNINNELVTDYDYVIISRIVSQEIGDNSPEEAIKAQAVASHTLIRAKIAKGIIPDAPMRTPKDTTVKYVKEVIDKFVFYNGKMADTIVYFHGSGGKTQNAEDVWGYPHPYLVSVDSPYERDNTYDNMNRIINAPLVVSADRVKELVTAELGEDIVFQENPGEWFKVIDYTAGGYVKNIKIGSGVTTGRILREKIFKFELKSCNLAKITYNDKTGEFSFYALGWGHGVGMSQVGAIGFASNGYNYKQIIYHYFKGCTVQEVS